MNATKYKALWNVMKREGKRLVSRPLYLFCMVVAPLFCYVFFTTLMDSGLPQNMPVGVVDEDMTTTSRQLVRNLDAFYAAFGVTEGDELWLDPDLRVAIWA